MNKEFESVGRLDPNEVICYFKHFQCYTGTGGHC